MTLEQDDLNMYVNFAVVCQGKMCDMLKLREDVRKKYANVKVVFLTMSPEYLFILKKSALTQDQLKDFSKEAKK